MPGAARSCRYVLELGFAGGFAIVGTVTVEERRGLERQLGGAEIRRAVGENEIVRGDVAFGRSVDLHHHVDAGHARVDGALDQADERLVAAYRRRGLLLAQSLFSPPLDQAHFRNPKFVPGQGYFGASYLVNGHNDNEGAEYYGMSYRLLVMRPGNRLREMRKAAGVTQKALADATGVTQGAISNLENGTRPLTIEWMRAFARVLGCAAADLLDSGDNPDRLSDEERELVQRYRAASQQERQTLSRVAEAVVPFTPAEDQAA